MCHHIHSNSLTALFHLNNCHTLILSQRAIHRPHLLQASVPDFSEGKARLQEAELIPPLGREMTVDHQCTELEDTSIIGGLRIYCLLSVFWD